jgi:polygalacturonase
MKTVSFLCLILILCCFNTTNAAVTLPVFPNATFTITSYGASTSSADNSTAIQNAINACNKAGGGTVIIPSGTFLSGPVTMLSNVNLQLSAGALLTALPYGNGNGSPSGSYPNNGTTDTYSNFIYAKGANNIGVSGTGTIEGQGLAWWTAFKANPTTLPKRPCLIRFDGCTTIAITNIKLQNSPGVHITVGQKSSNATLQNLTINAPSTSPNTDGIDTWGPNVNIYNCNISVGDDNVAMDSESQNITIKHCAFGSGHGCSVGSFTTNVGNILVDSCTFTNTTNGMRLKTERGRGGMESTFMYSNLTMTGVTNPIFIVSYYPSLPSNPTTDPAQTVNSLTPAWQNITLKNTVIKGSPNAGVIYGLPELSIANITFDNVQVFATKGMIVNYATGVVFKNCSSINVTSGNAISSTYSATISGIDFTTGKSTSCGGVSTTLTKQGAASSNQTITMGSAIAAFSYAWTGASSVAVTGLPAGVTAAINTSTQIVSISGKPTKAGVFDFTITTVGGNPDANMLGSITVSPIVSITASSSTTFCSGGSVQLNANSVTGYTYQWNNNGVAISGATSVSYTAKVSGSYTVMVTSSGAIATSTAIVVTVNTTPNTPAVTSPVTYCQNASSTALTATGTSLLWYTSSTGGTGSTTAPTPTTSVIGTVNYYVSQTTTGCESSRALIAVTVNALPTAAITTSGSTTFCTGGSVTLSSSGGSSYVWENGTTQVGTNSSYTTTAAGSYTVEVTNVNGCKATSAATTVTINATSTAPAVTSPVTYCHNATAVALTATGTTLKWYDVATGGTGSITAPTPITTATGTTNYYVSQTNGCESTRALIAVTVNALPTAAITTSGSTTFCTGGSVMLSSSGGSSYVWKNGTTQVGTGASYSAITAGSYTVEVTNSNTCKATSAATVVTLNTTSTAPAVTSPVTYCQNASSTALTATGTSLLWYTSSTGGTGTPTAPTPITTATGTTNYYVTQTNGCESARALIAVTVNALPTAAITTSGSTTFCTGGSVILSSSGGSSYVWKNGTTQVGTAASYSAITGGSYTVEVTNLNTCKATSAATVVTVNTTPNTPAATSPVTYCQNANALALTATGTSLLWYTSSTGGTGITTAPTPITTATGTTNYYVTQTNGCESTRALIAVTINESPLAVITASSSTTIPAGGSVVLNANSGTGLGYVWYQGNTQVGTGISYTATAVGVYTVEVTNGSNCITTSAGTNVNVNTNQPSIITITSPTADAKIPGAITIAVTVTDPDGSISKVEYLDGTKVIGTSTSAPYIFNWTNPSIGSHVITVRVTDSNGGITTSAPVTITSVSTTTAVQNATVVNASVYPNPSNAEMYIESDMDLLNARFTAINVLGEEILLSSSSNLNGSRIDISNLSEGTYILIVTKGTDVLRKKITVIR